MTKPKINIAICDDHKLFRSGLCALFADFDMVDEIYEAGNGVELLELLKRDGVKPDLILLDLNMPVMDGVETTKNLKVLYPDVHIVILSMEDDAQLVSLLIGEGISGYLLKNADPEELELAVKMVLKNEFYFSSALSGAVLSSLRTRKSVEKNIERLDLNKRELDILILTCKELTASEIARELVLSPRTVEGYRSSLLEKTGTKNIAGLVIFAIKNSLVNI